MIPDDITVDHVRKAAICIEAEYRRGTFPTQRGSLGMHVEIDGRRYPPKYLISVAGLYTPRGKEIPANGFTTSDATRRLTRLGFAVVGENWD